MTTFDSSIPVVDIADFRSEDVSRRAHFLEVLKDALRRVGFFAVLDGSVDVESLQKGYDSAKQFFALDMSIKQSICDPKLNGQRGWVQSESAKSENVKDWKEFLHIGPENDDGTVNGNLKSNLWPKEMDLRTPMRKLYSLLDHHSLAIKEALSIVLGQDASFLEQLAKDGDSLMRVLYYPTNPPPGVPLAAAHTDIDLFTILPLATKEGLEVKVEDGTWLPVRVPPGAFIVNAGDMLTNLSNGLFKSSEHRVVAAAGDAARFSIVYFVHGPDQADMSPLATAVEQTGGKRLFPQATEQELLAERLTELGLASPELMSFLAASGLPEKRLDLGTKNWKMMQTLKDHGLASERVLEALREKEGV